MSPQENLLLVIAGTSIFTVGVLSLCAHFGSALSREKILLWVGLFAASRETITASPGPSPLIWTSSWQMSWDAGWLLPLSPRW
jgi:hypothetical protein